jgi:erythromycin esterase-like protein
MRMATRLRDTHLESDRALMDGVRRIAHPLRENDLRCYDPLIEAASDVRVVLIGEATHGTHEFYRERARITTRLIEELGVSFVAIEGDWPEAYGVNRFVRGGPGTAREALSAFTAFPTWMWGNEDTVHFVEWLRRHNDEIADPRRKTGFYGLDLYSLNASMDAVVNYLERVDPESATVARERFACFEPFAGKDTYAYSTGLGIAESCEREMLEMLRDLYAQRERLQEISPDDSYFYALMSAEAARDGERYYRSMYRSDERSWNVRDIHMMDTLDRLLGHFGSEARAVVWEHNTHIGDFRATADADGMVNVGRLIRERHPGTSMAVGFGTYEGSVTAASAWGEPPKHMAVPAAREDSYDNVFHQVGQDRFLIMLEPLREAGEARLLNEWRGQRAIGVVYDPGYEGGNYVPTRLADRYDAYIHIDRTRAVRPLNIPPIWQEPQSGDTYPTGY